MVMLIVAIVWKTVVVYIVTGMDLYLSTLGPSKIGSAIIKSQGKMNETQLSRTKRHSRSNNTGLN